MPGVVVGAHVEVVKDRQHVRRVLEGSELVQLAVSHAEDQVCERVSE